MINVRELKLYGLVLNDGERDELRHLCERQGIDLLFPDLFDKDEPEHYLWAFDASSIALAGTIVMKHFKQDGHKVFHLSTLKEFFKTKEWRQQQLYAALQRNRALIRKDKDTSYELYLEVCKSLKEEFGLSTLEDEDYFKEKKSFYTYAGTLLGLEEFGTKVVFWSAHYQKFTFIEVKELLLSVGNRLKLPKLTKKIAKEIDERHQSFLEKRGNK